MIGAICAGLGAYFSVRFTRYFETNSLTPFAVYCVMAGQRVVSATARAL